MVPSVEEVSRTDSRKHLSTSSDTTTGETSGTCPVRTSKVDASILDTFTTPRMVCDLEDDTAKGSNSGVDDHTIKFHLARNATVRAKMAPRRILG